MVNHSIRDNIDRIIHSTYNQAIIITIIIIIIIIIIINKLYGQESNLDNYKPSYTPQIREEINKDKNGVIKETENDRKRKHGRVVTSSQHTIDKRETATLRDAKKGTKRGETKMR